MYKIIIFDLDGTVADTLADLAAAVNFALERQGLGTYPVDAYRQFVGNGVDNLVKVAMADGYTPEGAARVKEDFGSYYADHCKDLTTAYNGVGELLKKLTDDGIDTAVISNKPDRFVPVILDELYPDHRFIYAWGQREGIARKPDPEALDLLINDYGCDKSDALYVGDSNVDVVFAHNAGIKVCGVSWGFRGTRELEEAGADVIVDSVEELYQVINNNYRLPTDNYR